MKEYALNRLGAETIATGHYARLWHRYDDNNSHMPPYVEEMINDAPERDWIASWGNDGNRDQSSIGGGIIRRQSSSSSSSLSPLLLAGADLGKDQSYFLCGVDGNAFRNVLFPLGDLVKKGGGSTIPTNADKDHDLKNQKDTVPATDSLTDHGSQSVREIAAEASLPTATKRESMGICFVGRRNFQSFISQYLPSVPRPGCFVDVDTGKVSFCFYVSRTSQRPPLSSQLITAFVTRFFFFGSFCRTDHWKT